MQLPLSSGAPWAGGTDEARACLRAEPRRPRAVTIAVSKADLARFHALANRTNVVTFTEREAAHPINFFEQRQRCTHCGKDRFRVSRAGLCCQDGCIRIADVLPPPMVALISEGAGVSKSSRSLNNHFRMAQMAPP